MSNTHHCMTRVEDGSGYKGHGYKACGTKTLHCRCMCYQGTHFLDIKEDKFSRLFEAFEIKLEVWGELFEWIITSLNPKMVELKMIAISQLRQFTLSLSFTRTDMSFLNFFVVHFEMHCTCEGNYNGTGNCPKFTSKIQRYREIKNESFLPPPH